MKVDVVQVKDVKIQKHRWWSNWIDVCVYDYDGDAFLLQIKVSRFNSKKFKHVGMKTRLKMGSPTINAIGSLTQMSSIKLQPTLSKLA